MGILCSLDSVKACLSTSKSTSNFMVQLKKSSSPLSSKDFKRKMVLGKGSYGKVLLVKKKDTDESLAMKIIKKKDILNQGNILMERKVMLENRHPFIVRLKYAYQDESHIVFLMEYLEGGDLGTALNSKRKKVSFCSIARFYMAEIVTALDYLHNSMNILYGDLKLSNILLDGDGHIRLIDFGSSKLLENGKKTSGVCGTPNYMAPEIILGQEYDKSADIWSLGCAFYEIFANKPPFMAKNDDALYKKIVEDEPIYPNEFMPMIADLIKKCLMKDPEQRPTISQIKNHEFFHGIDWEDVQAKKIAPPISLKLNTSDEEECTTNHSSSYISKQFSRNSVVSANFGQMRCETDQNIQEDFEDLFEDYASKSVKSSSEL